MIFKFERFNFNGEQLVGVDGFLNLQGITKPLHLNVERFRCGLNMIVLKQTCGADASTTIERSDFGIEKTVPRSAMSSGW